MNIQDIFESIRKKQKLVQELVIICIIFGIFFILIFKHKSKPRDYTNSLYPPISQELKLQNEVCTIQYSIFTGEMFQIKPIKGETQLIQDIYQEIEMQLEQLKQVKNSKEYIKLVQNCAKNVLPASDYNQYGQNLKYIYTAGSSFYFSYVWKEK